MRRAVERMRAMNKRASFGLQLTSMVDMFTILIVFLLESYSASAVHITPIKGMELPQSTSIVLPTETLKVVVSLDGIFVDDKKVLSLKAGKVLNQDLDANDPDFIKPLFKELDKAAKKSEAIAKVNKDHKFDGKIIMEADARLDYGTLKKVMYTSSLAGYADMKLATIGL